MYRGKIVWKLVNLTALKREKAYNISERGHKHDKEPKRFLWPAQIPVWLGINVLKCL